MISGNKQPKQYPERDMMKNQSACMHASFFSFSPDRCMRPTDLPPPYLRLLDMFHLPSYRQKSFENIPSRSQNQRQQRHPTVQPRPHLSKVRRSPIIIYLVGNLHVAWKGVHDDHVSLGMFECLSQNISSCRNTKDVFENLRHCLQSTYPSVSRIRLDRRSVLFGLVCSRGRRSEQRFRR